MKLLTWIIHEPSLLQMRGTAHEVVVLHHEWAVTKQMQERAEDIFLAFKEMAKATGGLTENTANPAFGFKKAVKASEQYYLLYYMPKNYRKEGKFKKIKMKVRNKIFSVLHRLDISRIRDTI